MSGIRKAKMDTAVYELKAQARVNLTSEYGWQTRSLRPVEVESVFGNIKILV
ncbi:transposase [Sporomusa sphaeroides DSM 2875]|uniref:transposase n=1 Tax=Sporomusa sphaeroides TaxID=47679 RepID=UPI00202E1E18|nr:transposase [Sporomusa sphaeroides]MCM0761506.1 transposase [Sporomusa sphaeroides DSM 2875]